MLLDAITVGHARDIIAKGAMPTILAGSFSRLGTDLFGVIEKMLEQFTKHADGALVGFVDLGVVVKVLVEVFPQFQIESTTLRAVANQGHPLASNIIEIGRAHV